MRNLAYALSTLISFSVVGGACANGGRQGMPGSPQLMSLEVQPATSTIAVDNGVSSAVGFTVVGHFSDGKTQPITDATFALDSAGARLGTLQAAQFSASGAAAGSGHVTAQSHGLTGMAAVNVTVHTQHVDPAVPADGPPKFAGTPSMGPLSPTIDYPLDGAIMPSSAKAPDVQWEGAKGAADLYRVKLTSGGAVVESIVAVTPTFNFDWQPSASDWSLLASSGSDLQVTVDHWDASSGLQGGNVVKLAVPQADVRGVIYYWDLSEGKMQRIDDTGRALAIPKPPSSPSDANNRCVACHVVSRDGRYLAGELWGGSLSGAVFDLSNPTLSTADPAPTVTPVNSYVSLFSTFNPDATRLMINAGTSLQVVDPKNGMSIMTAGTPLPTSKAAHPTWSPDGSLVAFINNIDGTAWAVDYTSGDLSVIAVTGPDTFAAPQPLVMSSTGDPAFKAPSWPTFTPDSKFIAYGAGVNSRGRNSVMMNGTTTEVTYPGALFVVGRAGGTPARLDAACSAQRNCYLPNFSPYDSGGYFWLVFYSLRDYGNAQVGTKGSNRRQMWVTAIDKSKLGSGDASSVPYWLPDQDPKTENMSAFWAVPPPLQ